MPHRAFLMSGLICQRPIRSHSIASGTLYPQYIPPCTPTGHSDGTIQGFSPLVESPGGYGHHHHQHAPTGWNMQPDGLGMLTFSPPGMSMFPPPFEQQQIEYSYYVPYSHPMQIPVRGQPMYAETGYHEFQQQQQAPSVFFGQYPPTGNQYYQHQQHQGYHVYAGYESRKHSLHSSSTSDVYPNTAVTASYNNNGGMLPHQTLPQGIRHIIIDNICPGVDVQILQDHFRDAGKMLDCKIIRYNNHENGNEARYNELSYPGQCYATATFSTVEEAERAVGMYNGSDLGGSRVVVRLDTEWDPSNSMNEDGNGNGNGDGGGESDWSRSQSYSLSFTTSSNALLASSVSSSTATSLGTFSGMSNPQRSQHVIERRIVTDQCLSSESATSQLSNIPTTNKAYYRHHQHRDRRDSGKEIFKPNTRPFLPSRSGSHSDCVDDSSSRSVSPTSGERDGGSKEEEKPRTETIMQPLVVNGSGPVGRAKM